MPSVTVSSTSARFRQEITIGRFHLTADEPLGAGGDETGPAPVEFILAGLGACKTMTVKMYAERKGWPLTHVSVELVYFLIPVMRPHPQDLDYLFIFKNCIN
jgi:putative redox protein